MHAYTLRVYAVWTPPLLQYQYVQTAFAILGDVVPNSFFVKHFQYSSVAGFGGGP